MSEAARSDEVFDLLVAGGGMVGASLALALAPLGLRVALVEAEPLPADAPARGGDDRSIALANGSTRVFAALGVWEAMRREATPIRRIHVSERGRFGAARIDAAAQNLAALGWVVPQHTIAGALRTALRRHPGIVTIAPATAESTTLERDARTLQVRTADDERELRGRLLVAADGAGSALRSAAGIDAERWDYQQVAIVSTLTAQKFHDHVAYERFTPEGPIALLPLADGRCGLVWTRSPTDAEATLGLDDRAFIEAFQQSFGMRLGRFLQVGPRRAWPLAMTRAERHTGPRLALVGNAAQGLHPVAGQGFNLGLRDAVSLAETIVDLREEGILDAGDEQLLDRYRAWREQDSGRISAFTDGLVRLFGSPLGSVRTLRGLGLLAFDAMPPAKDALARLSVGAAGRVPKLARGAPLGRSTPA